MKLHLYYARRFLAMFMTVMGGFLAMIMLLDLIEQARQYGDEGASALDILKLTLLNLPQGVYGLMPLVMIMAAIAFFLAFARSSELVVTRAAGRSALVALLAPIAVTFLIGLVTVLALNPIVAATSRAYEAEVGGIGNTGSLLAVSDSGLWLRQGDADTQTVIHAERANLDGTILADVTLLTFGAEGRPQSRIDGNRATLREGTWVIEGAKFWPLDARNPEAAASLHERITLPSSLTADQIRDSFGTPSSIPIWDLPAFIDRLQDAGFSARRHQMHLQAEIALPVFLVAMVLIAAGFTMRHQRGGRTGIMVLVAVLLSFGLYFIRNFAMILGEAGQIPPALAAWAPPLAAIGLSLGFLLHLEDG